MVGAAGGIGGGGRLPPLTLTMLILCIVLSLLSNFSSPGQNNTVGQMIDRQLSFVTVRDLAASDGDPLASIRRGEVWRTVTPIFLHGSPLHLAFNMFMFVMLGRIAERMDGTSRYALLLLLLAIIPNLIAGLMPMHLGGSPRFVGISGVVYGLATYLWISAQQRPELGFQIPSHFILLLVFLMVLGFAGVLGPQISNWSHLGGFVTGLAIGIISARR
jgi:GlpG protein